MSFYSGLKGTATNLLKKFGQAVTITRQTVGTYNPATGVAAVTTSTQNGFGAIFDYTNPNEIDGTLVLQSDKKLILSATGITAPLLNDTVLANGTTYTIKGIKTISPANSVVVYQCQLRAL